MATPPHPTDVSTCVLTLQLDQSSQLHFDELRKLYFPPERNHIDAHLTLFHQLPESEDILSCLDEKAKACSAFPLTVSGVYSLGKGVAYRIESSTLLALHGALSDAFDEFLTPQDRQRFRPHIVVQNKVTPHIAQELLARLQSEVQPRSIQACGMDLWRYMGGPWEHLQRFSFEQGVAFKGV